MRILCLILLLSPSIAFCQKIQENRVDDFTGNSVKRTTWEKIEQSMANGTFFIQASKLNSYYYIGLKVMLNDQRHFAISEGSKLMFKLVDGQILTVNASEYAITGRGDGARGYIGSAAIGIKVDYQMPKQIVDAIAVIPVEKVRMYTNDGYVEFELSEKRSKLLSKTLELVK